MIKDTQQYNTTTTYEKTIHSKLSHTAVPLQQRFHFDFPNDHTHPIAGQQDRVADANRTTKTLRIKMDGCTTMATDPSPRPRPPNPSPHRRSRNPPTR